MCWNKSASQYSEGSCEMMLECYFMHWCGSHRFTEMQLLNPYFLQDSGNNFVPRVFSAMILEIAAILVPRAAPLLAG